MNYYIITGASRGIGEAIAKQLISTQSHIVCVSRSGTKNLEQIARDANSTLRSIVFDLAATATITSLIDDIFQTIHLTETDSVFLINNAGVIQPIAPLEKCDTDDILTAIQVNYAAPMLLCAAFIAHTKLFAGTKRIINISSGAGLHPYHGWSAYCTTKAALTMLTQCIAVEQKNEQFPVEVLSVTPGIIETNMQEQIRATAKENFAALDFFIDMKQQNKSKTAEYAASKIVDLIHNPDIKSGEFYDFIEL